MLNSISGKVSRQVNATQKVKHTPPRRKPMLLKRLRPENAISTLPRRPRVWCSDKTVSSRGIAQRLCSGPCSELLFHRGLALRPLLSERMIHFLNIQLWNPIRRGNPRGSRRAHLHCVNSLHHSTPSSLSVRLAHISSTVIPLTPTTPLWDPTYSSMATTHPNSINLPIPC